MYLTREPDGVNATGLYRRKFSLPRTWEGGGDRFFLVFEGVGSIQCADIKHHRKLNPKFVLVPAQVWTLA